MRHKYYFSVFQESPDFFLLTQSICHNIDSQTATSLARCGVMHLFHGKNMKEFIQCTAHAPIVDFYRKTQQAMVLDIDTTCSLCKEKKDTIPPLLSINPIPKLLSQARQTVEYAKVYKSNVVYSLANHLLTLIEKSFTQYSSQARNVVLIPATHLLNILIIEALVHYTQESEIPEQLLSPQSSASKKAFACIKIFNAHLNNPYWLRALYSSPLSNAIGAFVLSTHEGMGTQPQLCASVELLEALYNRKTFLVLCHAFFNFGGAPEERSMDKSREAFDTSSIQTSTIISELETFFQRIYAPANIMLHFTQDLTKLVDKPYFSHVFVALMEWKRIMESGTQEEKILLQTFLTSNPYDDPVYTVFSIISYAIRDGNVEDVFDTPGFRKFFPSLLHSNWETTMSSYFDFLAQVYSQELFLEPLARDFALIKQHN